MRIEQAITLAAHAHDRQVDKAGMPYIFHLMRVCLTTTPKYQVAAILHDILEDTEWTQAGLLAEGVSEDHVHIVAEVTRLKDHETYAEYIDQIVESGSEGALLVKQADLMDHLYNNPHPIKSPGHAERYQSALLKVNEALILLRRIS